MNKTRKSKIFASLLLAVLLFAIPQAVAVEADQETIEFEGQYVSNYPEICGDIQGTISENKDSLEANIIVRGFTCDINLEKFYERGDLVWFDGTFTFAGRNFRMRMLCRIIDGSDTIMGDFACPELNFEGRFFADIS